MIVHLKEDNFASYIVNSQQPVLVDFWAEWCGPCKMLAPVLEELAKEAEGYVIAKVNVDEDPNLASGFGVASIPTLLLFKEGEVVAQSIGYHTKEQLKLWLQTQGV